MADDPKEPAREYIDDHMFDDEDDFIDIEDDFEECGMMADGQCMLAGTEFCDWDCPRDRPVKRK